MEPAARLATMNLMKITLILLQDIISFFDYFIILIQLFIIIIIIIIIIMVFVLLINTVLLLGAPMLPTRWAKISTYLQSEQSL
jgi:hypothetical protein